MWDPLACLITPRMQLSPGANTTPLLLQAIREAGQAHMAAVASHASGTDMAAAHVAAAAVAANQLRGAGQV